MEDIPSNIMLDILSRIRLKPLVRLQRVSKLWRKYINDFYLAVMHGERFIEEPTPIMLHLNPPPPKRPRSLCFHVIDQSRTTNNTLVFRPKKVPDFEIMCKKLLSKSSITNIEFLGSCHGLIYVSEDDGEVVTTLAVIHPIKKQCYKLPTLPIPFYASQIQESCGIGFDSSTNTIKMVCVVLLRGDRPAVKKLCTMVHVLGTNKSWQEIPQVPSYPIVGEGIFANGCLHWLASYHDSPTKDERHVVSFDVKKEEFGLINPVKTVSYPTKREFNSCLCDHLGNLNGQVGYFCNRTTEVWVLDHKKEWVLHCNFEGHDFPYGYLKVLGCLNKEGDIFINCTPSDIGKDLFYVYNLRSRVLHEADFVGGEDESETNIVMFPNSLFSIHDIITNNNSIKKTCLRKKNVVVTGTKL
ncbi:F-box domain-containing protein [Artemisia annua]|uniref:F-box domain-containing protein n=1 Tax=Artemisia annua TaxID=35608 RepID=A0A2U1Q7Z8_ARTAN|nr:F-box domain-containing protein [Artemisia annua]